MDKSKMNQLAHESLVILGLLLLVLLMTRLWPLFFLGLIGMVILSLRIFYLSIHERETTEPLQEPRIQDRQIDHAHTLRDSFRELEKDVSQQVRQNHPEARWVWEEACPMERLAQGRPAFILLNKAGGYRRAQVRVTGLQQVELRYEDAVKPAQAGPADCRKQPIHQERNRSQITDQALAKEWTDEHIDELNDRCNDAIAQGKEEFLIPLPTLPEPRLWPQVAIALRMQGFAKTSIAEDGIMVFIPTE